MNLEDAGAAAVVMYSLFEEQIGFDSYYIDHHLHGELTVTQSRSAISPTCRRITLGQTNT